MAVNADNLRSIDMSVEEFEALTDETLTDRMLADLRFIGAPPPPLVTAQAWTRRTGDKEISAPMKRAIGLAALGKSNHEIAEELGYNYQTVSKMTREHEFKMRVAHKQALIFQHDVKGYIKTLMNKAYGTLDELISNESGDVKDSIRLETAKFIIDHTAGKASQTVEVKGNLLGDLIKELDGMKDVGPGLLATPIEPDYVDVPVDAGLVEKQTQIAKASLGPLKDEMDDLVAELVPDDFTVGKRS